MNFTKTKAYFDDGTPLPDTIKIKDPVYDTITRKFTGYIYFGNDKYFNGALRMHMQFVFSKDFKRIEDGWLQMKDFNREIISTESLFYGGEESIEYLVFFESTKKKVLDMGCNIVQQEAPKELKNRYTIIQNRFSDQQITHDSNLGDVKIIEG